MRSSVSVILDKRRKSTTGENKDKYPIKIKVNFKTRVGKKNKYVVRRYPTGVFAKEGQDFRKKRNDSTVILALAKAVDLHAKNLSVKDFERLFTGSGRLEDIKSVFDSVIAKLREEERDGTADAYRQAYSSFEKFRGEYISFESITVDWLKEYERWMLKEHTKEGKVIQEKHSINTVGIYLRALRTIFKVAIRLRIISADIFPFGIGLYVIPTGKRKTKKAFTREEKNVILAHRSEWPDVNRALDYWVYAYLSSGCNMADVAYLQFKNIDGEWVEFDRKKTENTERDKQSIAVLITDRMRKIIDRHGNKSKAPDDYVFPILRYGMTSKQRKSTIKDFIKDVNALLLIAQNEINSERSKDDAISVKLTTGTARYTAATLLRRQGIDLADIAKSLGHGSEATTENYTEKTRETQLLISKTLEL